MIKINLAGIFFRFGDLVFQSRGFKVFGMFLIGLVVGRTHFYKHLGENKRLLWSILIGGLLIGLPANYIVSTLERTPAYFQLKADGLKQTIAYALGVAPLALAYAALVALLYNSERVKKFLNILAPAGRMALTNYFMHTIIGLLTFSGLGLALKPFGPTSWTIFAVCVFIVQIIVSTIWLRFFEYGPLEWIWRQLTYGKRLPLKK